MRKSCSIMFYDGWIDVAPTIINIAKVLSEKGYKITIFCRKNEFTISGENEFLDTIASVVYFRHPSDIFLLRQCLKILTKLKLGTLIPTIDIILFFLQIRIYKFQNKLNQKHSNELIIGVDTNGSILSLLESFFLKSQNLVYLSLELDKKEKFKFFDKARFFVAKIAYKKSKCLIIQDEDRFKTITEYNKYNHTKVFYVPNSDSSTKVCDSEDDHCYFRRLLDLDEKNYPYIVLQAGMICNEVFSKELAQSFNSIDVGCAFIFHERQKRSLDDPYIQSLKEINSKNLFLSLDPLPYKDIHKIFTSAKIGIACYKDIDKNFSQISKASGKLALYMKYGKPVLMNDLQSLINLNEEYKIGVIIKDPSDPVEIKSAIQKIIQNYEYFSKNALICFDKEFDFMLKINPFLDFLVT